MTSMQEGMFWKTSGNIQKAQIGSFADSHLFIHGTNSTWKMECNCYRKTGKLQTFYHQHVTLLSSRMNPGLKTVYIYFSISSPFFAEI